MAEARGSGTLQVRLFAGARAAAGVRETTLPVQPAEPLREVLGRLELAHPGLRTVLPACSFLLDGVAAPREEPVGGAGTLDVLPPFSGG